ncbi:GNAT family N-acetyltransferase [Streptomyces sp. S1D4-20]|uniref:GNAT family N-acetyltransferase n=1 Tax=Streptomyces sp. S1D4-20 TaxID=2594462 RepID=UPI0011641279|nr:GNAT family N-acetyltransferase [Streptomyces sp. S1D4-20]QDN54039.1 GNAT family N-acetyltransferase [Streptomyces sp. S1D4-20]
MSAAALDDATAYLLASGELTLTRVARAEDLDQVNALHARCTLATRFSRYQAARRDLRPADWSHLTDPARGTTWITTLAGAPEQAIAVSHLMRTDRDGVRELGLLIEDERQHQRLGTQLTGHAVDHAVSIGCHTIAVMTGAGNQAMLAIARRRGATIPRAMSSTVDLDIPVAG